MTAPFAHQASCVAVRGRALLIEGPPGSGKSSLALALIDRGAALIGDDGVILTRAGDRLLASPHPRIAGKLEVRNLGLIDMPTTRDAPLAMVIRLDEDAPRYVEEAETIELGGVSLPMLRLWPGGAVLALKVELALEKFA